MRVLVAGAGGFLGLGVTRALAGAGHEVAGLVRRPESRRAVEAAGGRAVLGDVLDPGGLAAATRGVEAVVHLAIDARNPVRSRVAGCRNLLDAARDGGARRFVLGSGVWMLGSRRATITEGTPPAPRGGVSPHNLQAERAALAAAGAGLPEVVIVRPGMVYGNGSWFASIVHGIRAGTYRYAGRGLNHWPTVHLEDAARAFGVALERGRAGEAYLVADDAPPTVRAFTGFVAGLLRAPAPTGAPLARLARSLGTRTARAHAMNQVVSNARIAGLGWRPRFSTHREGVPAVLREMRLIPGA